MGKRAECIFCQIADGEAPANVLYQDNDVVAFRDINPRAPVHVVIIPRVHIASLAGVGTEHRELMGHIIQVANQIARSEGIAERGYRLVVNCGPEGGQVVPHLHFHLLGGRRLSTAMG